MTRPSSVTTIGLTAALLVLPMTPLMPLAVVAQSAPAAKPAAPVVVPAPASEPATTPAQGSQQPYTYDPAGRRDPFVSLVSHGADVLPTGKHADGLTGISTAELLLKGVLQSQGAYIALVGSPDGKTYTAHVNDKLADGTIRSITPQGIVIMQEVNDPLSLIKQKEVRKGLRASDDVK